MPSHQTNAATNPARTPAHSRDNSLWRQCWRDRHTDDFHQKAVNPLLTRFWPGLELAAGSRVFVPLCGKSLDMLWLAGQGHEVVGVELSPVAVGAFFRENHPRQPARRKAGDLTAWEHGRLRVLCGDYFALTRENLGPIDAVYDRAALTALPEDIRQPYVDHLRWLTPQARRMFLLTTEDAEEGETLAEAQAASREIESLYERDFQIELAHVESRFDAVPGASNRSPQQSEHKVYRLSAR